MSIEAMMWVKNDAPTTNSTEMCILYALAERANDDGTGCWPYYETLADEARCSLSTVKRHIKQLEDRGLILRGDQGMVSRYPARRRPVVWDLNMALRRDSQPTAQSAQRVEVEVENEAENERGQSDTAEMRGVIQDSERCHPGQEEVSSRTTRGVTVDTYNHPITTLEPLVNHPAQNCADVTSDDLEVEFAQWWSIVPRKKAKGDARKAFKAARKLASLDELTEGMIRSRRRWEAEGRDASKIPYPATWLRAESWADEDDDWSTPARPAAQGNTVDAWLGTQAEPQRPALDVADDAPFGDNVIEHDEGGALW